MGSKYDGKALYISLNGQLNMQNSDVTINNVMQDTTDFTLFARSNIAFSKIVKRNKDLQFNWEFFPDDIHGTVALPSIRSGLISLFEWFQMENTDKINSFDTPKDELLEIIRSREKKLKNHFGYSAPPYPEELLNMLGIMNMDMQQPEKAKMYFELAIEYYPKSANSYDAMSDYYKLKNNYTKALQYATQAFEIDDNEYYKNKIEELKAKNN